MRAAVLTEYGGPEVITIQDRKDPEPAGDEVIVNVKACGLNHLDIWARTQKIFPRPLVPGTDVTGTVAAIGFGVKHVDIGDEVILFPGFADERTDDKLEGYFPICKHFGMLGAHRDGGCAEKIAVPAELLLDKPKNVSWVDAAAIPIVFLTSWHMLMSRACLRPGETILIQSAGSGVGHVAIQMAKLIGATVITTTGGEAKRQRALDLGADHVLDYKSDNVAKSVRQLTGGRGADVVLDHNGPLTWEASLKSLSRGGRYVTCGSTGGPEVTLNLTNLFYTGQSILGSTLGTRSELAKCIQLISHGKLKPIVDKTFPLEKLAAAHEYLESPDRFGKVVIKLAK
jgi:NADPH:quinone reductase-like Zn-dependent oxidoreductase